jgi:phosphatidylethanolamine/phosphatidyl-N-methylethanolamine N-methyltransferase
LLNLFLNKPLQIYRWWAPVYDAVFARLFAQPRRAAIERLDLLPGERLLVPGIGTGLDLPYIPTGCTVVGGDFSGAMLAQARDKPTHAAVSLLEMDAQCLPFRDATFDALLFALILTVVPDGAAAFREGWRVLKPGGRAVIFDKFLPETQRLTPGRQKLGQLIQRLGTDPNRHLSEILGAPPDLNVVSDEPALFGGQYRLVLLRKRHPAGNEQLDT